MASSVSWVVCCGFSVLEESAKVRKLVMLCVIIDFKFDLSIVSILNIRLA